MQKIIPTLLMIILGAAIMFVLSLLQGKPNPPEGEYHYSNILRENHTWISITVQSIAGLALGYFYRFNPFLIGICLIAIFPITALIEATIYRGSHNLIPFELIIHFVYGLPAVAAGFAGKLLSKKLRD
jgi:hypothetical protein